ncbi:MAG: hypothetical protein FWC91_13230, partial [Defluviitaleaceae bacterium]|nr:hypothetical protein [Defluviitaleaceae bacterium]
GLILLPVECNCSYLTNATRRTTATIASAIVSFTLPTITARRGRAWAMWRRASGTATRSFATKIRTLSINEHPCFCDRR